MRHDYRLTSSRLFETRLDRRDGVRHGHQGTRSAAGRERLAVQRAAHRHLQPDRSPLYVSVSSFPLAQCYADNSFSVLQPHHLRLRHHRELRAEIRQFTLDY